MHKQTTQQAPPLEHLSVLPAAHRLAALQDWLYEEGERRLLGGIFEIVGPQAMRGEHDQIIASAQRALRNEGLPEEMGIAAAIVLWCEDVSPLSHHNVEALFGPQVADWVSNSLPSRPIEGDKERWEVALATYAAAPSLCQSLRMALLWGLLDSQPDTEGHIPFSYREARVMEQAAPRLRERVLGCLEKLLLDDSQPY
jgi:hypothetical protein